MLARARFAIFVCLLLCLLPAFTASASEPDLALFFQAARSDTAEARAALQKLAASWRNSYAAMLLDLIAVIRPAAPPRADEFTEPSAAPDTRARIRTRLFDFLEQQTGQRFGPDLARWRKWSWQLADPPHPDYSRFKAELYASVDPKMRAFFTDATPARIRLDEVEWGGVRVNGIPPLDHPRHIAAGDAGYLKDDHTVFGIVVNGEARAYPKRILAWHEMARDTLGGVELTVVYCTLCGTVMPYESAAGGIRRTFGTSGLLYRSNKLMFDEETFSLWSTLEGRPVIGKLAASDLRLKAHAVVTTTWAEWKAQNPRTTVLALDTGHRRDYSEGAAYREYFATHDLMFAVSRNDTRLRNKAEVAVMLLEIPGRRQPQPVAISAEFLKKNPLYRLHFSGSAWLVVTSPKGANRVYEVPAELSFRSAPPGGLEDSENQLWHLTEEAMVAAGLPQRRLARVPSQRAFWFGWYAQFPETLLVK